MTADGNRYGLDAMKALVEAERLMQPRPSPETRERAGVAAPGELTFEGKLNGRVPEEVEPGERGHRFFAMIPNAVVQMGLPPHAIALYVYYKKIAGDSHSRRIYEGAARTGRHLRMSNRTVGKMRHVLSARGLIATQRRVRNGT